MKPLILDLAKDNPTNTIIVVCTGLKPADDPPGDDPSLHLFLHYETTASPYFGENDESFRVYVFKP